MRKWSFENSSIARDLPMPDDWTIAKHAHTDQDCCGFHILIDNLGDLPFIGHRPRLDRCWDSMGMEFT